MKFYGIRGCTWWWGVLHLPFGWFQAGKMEHTHFKDINCLQVMILVYFPSVIFLADHHLGDQRSTIVFWVNRSLGFFASVFSGCFMADMRQFLRANRIGIYLGI